MLACDSRAIFGMNLVEPKSDLGRLAAEGRAEQLSRPRGQWSVPLFTSQSRTASFVARARIRKYSPSSGAGISGAISEVEGEERRRAGLVFAEDMQEKRKRSARPSSARTVPIPAACRQKFPCFRARGKITLPLPWPMKILATRCARSQNQKALVTGANSGIGEACALALGAAGADVVGELRFATGRSRARRETNRGEGSRALALHADVSNEAAGAGDVRRDARSNGARSTSW